MTLALMHPANWRIADRASKRPAYGGSPGARVYRCGNPSSPIVFTNSNPPSSTANMQPTYPLANPPNVAGAIDGAAIINRFFPKAHFVSALLNDPLGKWTDDFRAAEPRTEMGRTLLDQLRWNGSL